nr:DUF4158 domain-containing protein [Streptomyces taklimakanensis]
MATRVFSDEAFLRKFLRPQTVLGAAVQLCTLPWLGFVPYEVPSAPPAAVGRLARQLGLPVEVLRGYGVVPGADTYGSSAAGGDVSGVAAGEVAGVERVGRVPAGPRHGA